MTIDTRDVNELGPGKFRTSAENGEACYFKTNKSDTHFTSFFARRSQADPRRFSFVKPNSDFELVNKSLDFRLNNSVLNGELKRKHQSVNSEYFSNGRSKSDSFTQRRDLFSQSTDVRRQSDRGNSRDQSTSTKKSQDFSQDKIVNRHKIRYTATRIKYSPTRIKSRDFLSNISYTGISKSDFYNENFILDVFVLLVKNLNSFSLSRKITDKTKHDMAYMLRRECIPSEFYRYISEEKNFLYLNDRDVCQPTVLEIVGGFIDQGKQNL